MSDYIVRATAANAQITGHLPRQREIWWRLPENLMIPVR